MNYYLAPMEGITGYVFRNVYHHCFPAMDKYFTPFLSPNQDGKLSPREYQDVAPEHNEGMKVVPQILTNCAEDFIRTAKTLKAMGYDEVNFNLGCPSGTVVSKGKGSGFLAFPEKLDQCLDKIFSGLDMKISIKTRIGKEQPEEFERLLEIYNQYKMEELIIHPRVQRDGYRNTAYLPAFYYAYTHSSNPICYNGDIFQVEDGQRIKEKFPELPAVMLGRGIVANPGLLMLLKQDNFLVNHDSEKNGVVEHGIEGKSIEEQRIEEKRIEGKRIEGKRIEEKRIVGNGSSGLDKASDQTAKEHLRNFHDCLYEAYCRVYLHVSGPKVVLFKMKEIWCYLASSFDCGNKAVKKIKKAQSLQEYEAAVSLMFSGS